MAKIEPKELERVKPRKKVLRTRCIEAKTNIKVTNRSEAYIIFHLTDDATHLFPKTTL